MQAFKVLTLVVAGILAASAHAAAFPERNITVIVPFPPGGASDATARVVTAKLAERVGQTVVVDNRAGANGALGAVALKQARPDGYTLLIGSIGVFAINPALFKDLKYDPEKDFDLLTVAVRTPNVLVANPRFPVNSVRELIEHLKKNPDKVTFASSGTGWSTTSRRRCSGRRPAPPASTCRIAAAGRRSTISSAATPTCRSRTSARSRSRSKPEL